ncbi:MAG: bifunctional folylpolyglutamate synthase/dihydrofolate synthase [Neptuniibacter sp. Phe_28]|nr:MAG: bifunctional folylpolyglutamate synthase/dihydrofolate synthase [Neptuniibacter sp. Phe_28]
MNQTAKNFTLSEWLTWMETCHSSEIELGLERVSTVADLLSLDLSSSKVITVAGTNGKGSTVSYLDTIYRQAGYSVGCFTSPHFTHYNERVKINGVNSADELLCAAFARIDQARGQIPLTYFEFGTLAALVIFSDLKPDVVLLEVGLGGRLDAVNIIDADLSVVTTVALDHMDWLGDNRDVIGREKAGVFRADKPAICGDLNPPESIAAVAHELNATLFQAGNAFSYLQKGDTWSWCGTSLNGDKVRIDNIPLPQLPLQNAATALQVIQCAGLDVADTFIRSGIAAATLTGRMQLIEKEGTRYWLDVAHNPEAAALLSQKITAMEGDVTLVLGMLADKDCGQVIELLAPTVDHVYFVDLNIPRGQKASALASYLPQGRSMKQCASVSDALNTFKNDHNRSGNVIIAGSFFTVSDALAAFGKEE